MGGNTRASAVVFRSQGSFDAAVAKGIAKTGRDHGVIRHEQKGLSANIKEKCGCEYGLLVFDVHQQPGPQGGQMRRAWVQYGTVQCDGFSSTMRVG